MKRKWTIKAIAFMILCFYDVYCDFPFAHFVGLRRSLMEVPVKRKNVVQDLRFRYFFGRVFSDFNEVFVRDTLSLPDTKTFNATRPTLIYIPGWVELPDDQAQMTVISAYLDSRWNGNVILLDWSNMAYGSYFTNAKLNVPKTGRYVGRQLARLAELKQLDPSQLHVVGHSLGAHVAGHIGDTMKKLGYKIRRITGLDPALPGFYPVPERHLGRADAVFVDTIHTDAGRLGTPVSLTVDFWPNAGVAIQPGCSEVVLPITDEDFCSHQRSWEYWADSVRNPFSFPALRCSGWVNFSSGRCQEGEIAYLGIKAEGSMDGDYFLTTNAKAPFGKGVEGISPRYHHDKDNEVHKTSLLRVIST